MKRTDEQPAKIGAGHASAMFRQGLSELRAAVFPDSNVAQPPQYGLYGTRTPGEVAEARRADGRDNDEEPTSVLDEKLREADANRALRDREAPNIEKE